MADNFLEDLHRLAADTLSQELHKAGVPEAARLAEHAANELTGKIYFLWGGQQAYVGLKGDWLSQRICAEFTGDNVNDLVRKYRISAKHVYRILQQDKQRRAEQRQVRLPGV